MHQALVVNKTDAGIHATLQTLQDADLPAGDVTVRIRHSTLNYKDALAITGKAPVVRRFPLTVGIDFAGVVEDSRDDRWQPGDAVLLNGWGVGEVHPGGLAQRARVPADWLLPLPAGLSSAQAMALGTAGYTAMLCVQALQRQGVRPADGDILVTGANGGVGTVAIVLLAGLGYRVLASTGRPEQAAFLRGLGAAEVLPRSELSAPGKPLGKERWAGVVDSVGSHTLANACAGTRYGGTVAACGLAQGMDFPASVAPFILRGVTLVGIDSVMAPRPVRQAAWTALAAQMDLDKLEQITQTIGLSEAAAMAAPLLAGQVRGRLRVDVDR